VTTLELEPGVAEHTEEEEHEDEEPKFVHLYSSDIFLTATHTICGMPIEQDWHVSINRGYVCTQMPFEKGMMRCPGCDTPICMECLLSSRS